MSYHSTQYVTRSHFGVGRYQTPAICFYRRDFKGCQ